MKTLQIIGILLFVIIVNVGCSQSESKSSKVDKPTPIKEQVVAPKKAEIKVPAQQKANSGEVDKFGRNSSHPHYGHNHAVNAHPTQATDSSQTPASGKPDKYGRKPGHPHYGHNHK